MSRLIPARSAPPSLSPRARGESRAPPAAPKTAPRTTASPRLRSSASGRCHPPVAWRTGTDPVPKHQLDPVRTLRAEHVDSAVKRICLHRLSDQRSQALGALSEVDGLRRHHDADRACRPDHELAFKASIIAVTMPMGASRQIQTLAPSIASSITCGRATGLLSDPRATGASSRRSTTTGANETASSSACRRAFRRHENNCCGASPCRRATTETTAPGASDSSTACAFSATDHRRRRSPPPVITSIRRTAPPLGSSVGSSLDTSLISKSGDQTRCFQHRLEGGTATALLCPLSTNLTSDFTPREAAWKDGCRAGVGTGSERRR